jgi:hypothetical protein
MTQTFASPTPNDVADWLQWAGARLLAMPIASPLPREPHTAWPAFAQDARQAYGYTNERLRAAAPRANEIAIMDEILLLPMLVQDITTRRIIHARALVTPIAGRHLYSWTKLAFMLHSSRTRVARLHSLGLAEICKRLANEKAYAIQHQLSLLST